MLKLDEQKHPQESLAGTYAPVPQRVVVPFSQHIGKAAHPVVKKGDLVHAYQHIAQVDGLISSAVHSPVTGIIKDITTYNHPVLKLGLAAIIETKEIQEQKENPQPPPLQSLSPQQLITIIKDAGIVGMGGAMFPTQVKLSSPCPITTLVINGAECEPYLTCDCRLMIEKTEEIFRGIEIIAKILSVKHIVIAIENNKQEAIKRFNSKLHPKKHNLPHTEVAILPARYPQGAEKQLIATVLKKRVPAGGLPFHVGVVVENVATCFAIAEAVYHKKPLVERMVTFAGNALQEPKNLWVKIGTLVSELIENKTIILRDNPKKLIFGGPMMGVSVHSLDFPIIKGTSGVLFLSERETNIGQEQNCIRCARCVQSCPMGLIPYRYVQEVKQKQTKNLEALFLNDCIECGSCTFVCPAQIPIVHYIKTGKELTRKK